MSQHPSLRSSDKDRQHRSVLKRYERVKVLKDKDKWKDEDGVYGLQKVKVTKFKIKKEKAAAAETAEEQAAAPGTAAAAPQGTQQQAKAGTAPKAGPAQKGPQADTKK